ncbi:MAG: hypothetical protein FRX49_01457 [Trebouxia sp. A1-2]|nr:MAG: hypothetical protein FRX49_01457 [Trebouxia sp. A1-2]
MQHEQILDAQHGKRYLSGPERAGMASSWFAYPISRSGINMGSGFRRGMGKQHTSRQLRNRPLHDQQPQLSNALTATHTPSKELSTNSPASQHRVDDEHDVGRLLADSSAKVVIPPLADQQQFCQAGGKDGAAQQSAAEDEGQEEALGFWPVGIISGIEPRVSQSGHAQAEHACQKLCCYDGHQGPGNVGTNLGCHKAKEYATGSAYNEDSSNQAFPISACKPQSVVVATE